MTGEGPRLDRSAEIEADLAGLAPEAALGRIEALAIDKGVSKPVLAALAERVTGVAQSARASRAALIAEIARPYREALAEAGKRGAVNRPGGL